MKLIICLITLNAFSVLYAKDCHDCSVNKAPPTEAPLLSRLEEITKKVETIKEAKTRNSLCSDASSGKGNWKRFQQTFTDNKIEMVFTLK